MKTAIQSAKLTKSFLMSAQEGLFLVSNVGCSPSQPLFSAIVLPDEGREAQWRQIVACRANHRLCHLFKSPEDYLKVIADFSNSFQRN